MRPRFIAGSDTDPLAKGIMVLGISDFCESCTILPRAQTLNPAMTFSPRPLVYLFTSLNSKKNHQKKSSFPRNHACYPNQFHPIRKLFQTPNLFTAQPITPNSINFFAAQSQSLPAVTSCVLVEKDVGTGMCRMRRQRVE